MLGRRLNQPPSDSRAKPCSKSLAFERVGQAPGSQQCSQPVPTETGIGSLSVARVFLHGAPFPAPRKVSLAAASFWNDSNAGSSSPGDGQC